MHSDFFPLLQRGIEATGSQSLWLGEGVFLIQPGLTKMLQPFFLKVRITAQPFSRRMDNEA